MAMNVNLTGEKSEKHFPVDVISVDGGWAISMNRKKGTGRMLMQPGWTPDNSKPYIFDTKQDAWQFIQKIYRFCAKSDTLQQYDTHHLANCEGCGQVFKSHYSPFCETCLEEKDEVLKQFCEGMYYRTGSSQETLNRLAVMLKSSKDQAAEQQRQVTRQETALHAALHHGQYRSTRTRGQDTLRTASRYQAWKQA